MAVDTTNPYESLCAEARKDVELLSPEEFDQAGREANCLVIDIREPDEWEDGIIPGAILLPRGILERELAQRCPDTNCQVNLYCSSGKRSVLSALSLKRMGYQRVTSLTSGIAGWKDAGRTIVPGPCRSVSTTAHDADIDVSSFQAIRDAFAITSRTVKVLSGEERPLVYLDHAATTHPPDPVLAKYGYFLRHEYANVHRATYHLARRSTLRFEDAYRVCGGFVGADPEHHCVVFTSNTTSACELVAHATSNRPGKILLTDLEHHSNDLPYRRRCETIRIGLDSDMRLDMAALKDALATEDVKLVAVTGAANITGWMPPIHEIAELAHAAGALICVDAAQLLAHAPVSMGTPGDPGAIDFLVAAGHKAYAPFGAGFLVGPRDVLDSVEPVVAGGGVAANVGPNEAQWLPSPDRHQFGTPNVAGAIALAEMLKMLDAIGMDRVRAHELELMERMLDGLKAIGEIECYGPASIQERVGIVPFNVRDVSDMLTAAVLGEEFAVAVRNGRFCAHVHNAALVSDRGEGAGAVRASIGLYNNETDIEQFLHAVQAVRQRQWKGTYQEQGGMMHGDSGGRCADTWMEAEAPQPPTSQK